MLSGNSKRVVVIRDIRSNVIEEAILILKCDSESANSRNKSGNRQKKNSDFIIKEAEFIINNYIRENRIGIGKREEWHKSSDVSVKRKLVSTAINAMLIGSVALLVFVVSKIF